MTQPTYAELVELIVEMRTELNILRAENAALKVRVADLEARLRTNSQNSSKPPSADGPGKAKTRSLRTPSTRKPGGQDGHRGQTSAQVADPDVVIRHEPSCCTGCGSDLADATEVGCSRRQVFDIPPIKVHVTEHQIISRRCHCGKTSTGDTPAQAGGPVQYGPVMCAVVIYLFMGQFLSKKRTAQAISELFGIPVSDGTVAAVTSRAAGDLGEFLAQVTARLKSSPVVHFDETGLRCEGRNHWLHSASTPAFTRLFFHRRRGTEAMAKMNILPGFTGTAVHDAWAPYDTYTAARHALCNAHLLRELQAVTDHHHASNTDLPGAWCWAQQVRDALLTLHKAAAAHPDTPVDQAVIAAETVKIRHALLAATHPDGAIGRKHRALARRIHRREVDYLKFASDPAIPFTNNPTEQEIRMTKIRQKISGTMRTEKGAGHFADLRSYLQTTAKHGVPALAALTQLTSRNPWLPAHT
ncbi:IS66 family transposase [Nakamurella sp. PAMC28650]|uniref:IS66 family transposase n=1 Tax=Nakamurella sp. PAMC28650 TaxID=2762325 RepID=UPI00164D716D|nr:IS66 family transposase [Nakamurella sp. PAMC28650]QNK82074.1 IS66 family transposase [Nakamurella sp. PAMC28650]